MRRLSGLSQPRTLSPAEVEVLAGKLAEAARTGPVILVYLHGAHAAGTQGPLSDLDIAVLLEPAAARDFRAVESLRERLEAASGREDVDLAVLNTAGPILKDRVVRHGRLLHARSEGERVRFEETAIREYLDFQHFSRTYDDALFRRLREHGRLA